MTPAGKHHALFLLGKERDLRLTLLGPRPPWWRLLARRRWDRATAHEFAEWERWRELLMEDA